MRTLRLVRIAAAAEGVRLRRQARRTVVRAVLGIVALGFLAAALVLGHVAAWFWLLEFWSVPGAALALGGVDLVIAAALALLAARLSPGAVEREALAVRRRALDGAAASVELQALVFRLVRDLVDLLARRRSK
jgi:uncharacterized membrane protein YvlD (DUF360 family)